VIYPRVRLVVVGRVVVVAGRVVVVLVMVAPSITLVQTIIPIAPVYVIFNTNKG
jgi:hypothetical protein